jgi:Kef-type K+ transport system membrane component KefB
VHEPSSLTWDLLLLLLVILFGPYTAERLRLPGIIGLLLGGFLIGPTGLGLLAGRAEVESLGSIGLLYLMFLAGLELDLNVFARLRNAAITFGLLTFVLPLAAGTAIALWLGFDLPASILIGSLWASHTLVTYPIVQRYGLAADPAVATTVGATVITDTLALFVLAVIAGAAGGGTSNLAILVGLAVLGAYCFVALTLVARWFFAGLGQDRTLRFIFVVAAFLSAAVVAELGGIEGIVGAFFAGLALNRMVPNGGPLMERIEFFGSALFIPAFLVSVGLLIDPAVLLEGRTWILAAAFTLALVAGKGAAAVLIGRLRAFSWNQVQLVFSLSLAQAAATLAATTVGAQVGLFGDDVVNAVVVVIVISLFASSLIASRAAPLIAPPGREGRTLGTMILAAIASPDSGERLMPLLARIARADGGNVIPAHVMADGDDQRTLEDARAASKLIDETVRRAGLEAEPSLRVAGSVRQGIRNEISEFDASLLVLGRHRQLRAQDFLFGGTSEELVSASMVPVMVAEMDEQPLARVLLPLRNHDLAQSRMRDTSLALEIGRLLAKSGLDLLVAVPNPEALPGGVALPDDALIEPLSSSRNRWIAQRAGPGDLVLLPGGGTGIVFGMDAARVAALPGVSVAVIVGPFHASGLPARREIGGTLVVPHTGA